MPTLIGRIKKINHFTDTLQLNFQVNFVFSPKQIEEYVT